LAGESNYLNIAGVTGLREKIVLRNPNSGAYESSAFHTTAAGTPQQMFGTLEVTVIEYPHLLDLGGLSPNALSDIQNSMAANLLIPDGRKFRPDFPVFRGEFAEAIVRAGLVPQYSAGSPVFIDLRDRYSRSSVESIYANPAGRLIYDADAGGRFYPYSQLTRLAAAIAFVRAANLESAASTAVLPLGVIDVASIPAQWRGHVAIALQKGYLALDAGRFNPTRSIKRVELAGALVKIALRDN
jgi:hypothetical protein